MWVLIKHQNDFLLNRLLEEKIEELLDRGERHRGKAECFRCERREAFHVIHFSRLLALVINRFRVILPNRLFDKFAFAHTTPAVYQYDPQRVLVEFSFESSKLRCSSNEFHLTRFLPTRFYPS